ncbi:MAG: hypothetical protein BECKG1743D_GA0114223_109841, partial [Candidatus Kentron sp. G]
LLKVDLGMIHKLRKTRNTFIRLPWMALMVALNWSVECVKEES